MKIKFISFVAFEVLIETFITTLKNSFKYISIVIND